MASLMGLEIRSRVRPLFPQYMDLNNYVDAEYSHHIVCNVSNRYCCSSWTCGILNVLRVANAMATLLHVAHSATRFQNFLVMANMTQTGSKLPTLSQGLFSWIPQVWRVRDDEVMEAAGLDAYVVSPVDRFRD
jgi:Late exocytosis, associated with Golgi transport